MNKINEEIEKMAQELEKATQDPKEKLFSIIKALGPEGIKERLPQLSDDDKVVLKAAIEEMTLKKAISFDKEINSVHHVQGKTIDTIIQEDKADDDVDETLVKPEAAKMDHQGTPTDGWKGQVIKGKELEEKKDDKKKEEKKMKKSSENLLNLIKAQAEAPEAKDGIDLMEKTVHKMMDKCGDAGTVMDKCTGKGMDKKMVQGHLDSYKKMKKSEEIEKGKMKEKAMDKDEAGKKLVAMEEKEHKTKDPKKLVAMEEEEQREKKMKKSEELDAAQENPEAKEQSGDVAELEGGKKLEKRPKNLEVAEASKDAQEDVDNMNVEMKKAGGFPPKKQEKEEAEERDSAPTDEMIDKKVASKNKEDDKKKKSAEAKEDKKAMKKSLSWDGDERLLKANTQGRNFNFNVETFITETIKHGEQRPAAIQKAVKEDINDLIEKSQDRTWDQLSDAKKLSEQAGKQNGTLVKSFNETDVATILGLSEEEAKKILG